MTDDPFPRERVAATLRRLPAYARLGWRLAREPLLSRARRAAVVAAAGYLASPIDLVPGLIPVAGQLDDAAAVLFGLRVALAGLPPAERAGVLAEAGLARADLDVDLRTIGVTYAWLGRRGGRLAWRGARGAVRAAGRLGARLASRLGR